MLAGGPLFFEGKVGHLANCWRDALALPRFCFYPFFLLFRFEFLSFSISHPYLLSPPFGFLFEARMERRLNGMAEVRTPNVSVSSGVKRNEAEGWTKWWTDWSRIRVSPSESSRFRAVSFAIAKRMDSLGTDCLSRSSFVLLHEQISRNPVRVPRFNGFSVNFRAEEFFWDPFVEKWNAVASYRYQSGCLDRWLLTFRRGLSSYDLKIHPLFSRFSTFNNCNALKICDF